MKNQIMKKALVFLCLSATALPAFAVPITIVGTDAFRETRFNPPPFFNTGDNFLIDARVSDAVDTSVSVFNSFTSETFDLTLFGSSFGAFVPYSDARAMGDWIFTARNDGDTATATLLAYGTGPGRGPMPGVENLTVSGPLSAPTLTWDLPAALPGANDGNVDRLRTRIQDASGAIIFDSRSDLGISLSLGTTAFTIPEGFITDPGTYYAQVLIEGFDPVFVRSRTFAKGFTIAAVPEPSVVALLAAGLFGIGFVCRRKLR